MMKKLLTISVAAYNAASTLEECLRSMCLDERHMDELEVIITDDGSTDQGPQIAQGFIEKYPAHSASYPRKIRVMALLWKTA